ncbi:hypothetical protein [Rhodohalobacter sp. 8-1]|uniref:hypothetical protein n=1 Tax=Rhodohalobacter sp. 8-1 TaxID=3131972 RepID=UPI0030ED9192
MTNYAIFELVAVILAVPFSYLMAKLVKYYSRPNYRNEVDTDFQKEWNGKPEDEYEAWLRLRRKYLRQDVPGKYLDHIRMRMSSLNKREHLSNLSVSENGELYTGGDKDSPKSSETGLS